MSKQAEFVREQHNPEFIEMLVLQHRSNTKLKMSWLNLDSSAEDLDPAPMKSKYDTMDFDSLLKEAQKSLTR